MIQIIPKSDWQHYKETKDPPHVSPMGEPEYHLHMNPVDGIRIPQSDTLNRGMAAIDVQLSTYLMCKSY